MRKTSLPAIMMLMTPLMACLENTDQGSQLPTGSQVINITNDPISGECYERRDGKDLFRYNGEVYGTKQVCKSWLESLRNEIENGDRSFSEATAEEASRLASLDASFLALMNQGEFSEAVFIYSDIILMQQILFERRIAPYRNSAETAPNPSTGAQTAGARSARQCIRVRTNVLPDRNPTGEISFPPVGGKSYEILWNDCDRDITCETIMTDYEVSERPVRLTVVIFANTNKRGMRGVVPTPTNAVADQWEKIEVVSCSG